MERVLDLAVLIDDENDDDQDDALILHILKDEENLGNRAHFNLDNLSNIECEFFFRFSKQDLLRLCRSLGILDMITTSDRVTLPGVNGLCVLLRRLAYPNRLVDLEPSIGLCSTTISNICNLVLSIIHNNKCHLLENLRNVLYLNLQKLNQ